MSAESVAAGPESAGGGGGGRVLVFRNVRPWGRGAAVDLVVVDGLVSDLPVPVGAEVVEGEGRMVLPALVDAHIHPDKTTWGGPWVSRAPAQGIAALAEQDAELFRAQQLPVAERAFGLMAHAVSRGTRALRAHADVAPAYGLAGVEGVAEARERLRHALDVQITAFPQHGVMRAPGTAELLARAAREGLVDQVGGIDPTGFDGSGGEQLDLLFDLAGRHGTGLDLHLHERGGVGLATLRDVVARTRALGLRGRVTVSHAFCLAGLGAAELDVVAGELSEAGIALTTVAPGDRLVLPIAALAARGVRVGLGSDGVRDSWSPFGNADMMHRTHLLGWLTDARLDAELTACYETAAHGGAAVLGLPRADLTPGSPADLVLLRGECLPQVVVDLPPRDLVVHGGRVVARDGRLV
ncbi:amidohydrolase [Streptomyces sp. NPDC058045]|uniref:amidohydrolase n=1 Tax=Streptomyces sp. NPDC058045 TaxID=3346311 RepID=UPI0036EE05EA